MPATKSRARKKDKVSAKSKSSRPSVSAPIGLPIAAMTGALLGLSAPGFDHWYIAWFGLAPLLLLTVSSSGIKQAFFRGLVFGTAYTMMYASFLLHLYPLDWLGFNWFEGGAVAAGAWLIASLHQGLIVAIVAAVLRLMPLCGGFMPRQVEQKWCLPALLVVPVLWVLMENKIGNAHDWLGIPWTMIEYSQYKQLSVLQITSIIGGIGLGALIVAANTAIATMIATISQRLSLKSLSASNTTTAFTQLLTVACCVVGVVAFGYSRLAAGRSGPVETVSVVQGNINIDMQKNSRKRITLDDLTHHYDSLVAKAPGELCIWSESALPTYLKEEKYTLANVTKLAVDGKRNMIVGSIDKSTDGQPYNSAFGITSNGTLLPLAYHKRYLVPFGEYMPSFVKYLPEYVQRLTNTPAGTGFGAGKFPVVLNFGQDAKVAPLICFETISPELVSTSIRNGGHLLVNLSDLAWFHESIVGDQMVAFAVLRAVENGRDFVFAANTGPSVIIDSTGKISARTKISQPTVLTGRVTLHSELTPFAQWFN